MHGIFFQTWGKKKVFSSSRTDDLKRAFILIEKSCDIKGHEKIALDATALKISIQLLQTTMRKYNIKNKKGKPAQ